MDMTIATTIQAQIGHRALMMLGAYQLVALADGLKFRIRGCRQGNLIMVNLDRGADLYNVSLWSIRGANARCFDRTDGIGVDQLHATIERLTGLYTSLGTMGAR